MTGFQYQEINAGAFRLASWQRISDPAGVYKIYIEGDGHAFDSRGRATDDPTPRADLVRRLAMADPDPNIVYLARPCQYIKGEICAQRHWTTARFAPEIIFAIHDAVRKITGKNPVVLIGYSGGAQVAGLITVSKQGLNVRKIITIAGNLDHEAWTRYHKLPPLNESMNLDSYRRQFAAVKQVHYVGENDDIIPPRLVKEFVENNAAVIVVRGADHASGWEKYFSLNKL